MLSWFVIDRLHLRMPASAQSSLPRHLFTLNEVKGPGPVGDQIGASLRWISLPQILFPSRHSSLTTRHFHPLLSHCDTTETLLSLCPSCRYGLCLSQRGGYTPLPPTARGRRVSYSFRINTCKSVSKQTTLTPFRMNTYEKQGGRGYPNRVIRLIRQVDARWRIQ
jgi:hypothetical protein